jgi:ABC-type bacteriocin/lantibiotic exporter with double-glycine peptidase domain
VRPLLVPEVLQASALDCGPAALASLLAGFGVGCPFDTLREACRTGRDGTSIDDLEAVAGERGLEAEQILVPCDYLLLPEAACLPCILAVVQPGGAAHFVTLWRRHGGRVQVMDPAAGRRWPTAAALAGEVYRHRAMVPAAAWREWAASDECLRPLAARLERLGVTGPERQALLRAAARGAGWQGLGRLDAGVRFTLRLIAGGGARRGREAARVLTALLDGSLAPVATGPGAAVPAACWAVRRATAGPGGEERLLCEGAVLVRIRGLKEERRATRTWQARRGGAHRQRTGGRGAPGSRWRTILARLPAGAAPGVERTGLPPPPSAGSAVASLAIATGGAAIVRLAAAAALVAALELLPAISARASRLWIVAALLTIAAAGLVLELAADLAGSSLGRRREMGLRLRLAAKLRRLPDRYLRTRLPADLAERAHLLSHCRRGPELAAGVLRAGLDAVLAAAGICWLDPRLAAGAAAATAGAIAVPMLLLPRFEERSGRLRAHGAALGAMYLDVARGLGAVHAHGAEAAMRRRHDELLAGWLRARRAATSDGIWFETAAQAVLSIATAGLVLGHLHRHGMGPQAVVLVLWVLQLVAAGQRLAVLAGRELPLLRSVARRIEEPLAADDEGGDMAASAGAGSGGPTESAGGANGHAAETRGRRRVARPSPVDGVAIAFESVTIELEGHTLLRDLELAVPAGQHVAVLGCSGAGKSTLLGALLGWQRPALGRLLVDGRDLTAAGIAKLRRETAWAAPEVALWRSTLLENLRSGTDETGEGAALPRDAAAAAGLAPAEALRASLLLDLVPQLARGLQTALGEAGGWLSGGEAQRLRFARALGRPGVRLALLDEPFRGLGADQRRALLAAARGQWRQATLLCVTHSPAEAAGFDRLVVLEEGSLVEDGVPAILAGRHGSRYRAMLDAEERAGAALGGAGWRRLHLAAGRLREVPAGAATYRSGMAGAVPEGNAVLPADGWMPREGRR